MRDTPTPKKSMPLKGLKDGVEKTGISETMKPATHETPMIEMKVTFKSIPVFNRILSAYKRHPDRQRCS